jgi:hypothetical protein
MHNQTQKSFRSILFTTLLITILSLSLAGCQEDGAKNTNGNLKMAALEDMPAEVQSAPLTVQQAYQFAVANPDVMQQLPCYCGCGEMGHKSNYACYVSGTDANGKPVYDTHALGCSICVDITQDAMRLLKEGKSVAEIRQYVDATYAKYGPSNMP